MNFREREIKLKQLLMASPLGVWGRHEQFLPYGLEKMAKLICFPPHKDDLSQRVLVGF